MEHGYEFDIAISYKSEIEKKATRIAAYLERDGWNVFFAPIKQQELLSENIHSKLYDLYKNKSWLKLLLVSENYLSGEWTSLEMRMALKSTRDDRKRLLIVNYTNMLNLPGELGELQYMDGSKFQEDEIASVVTERLEKYLLHKPTASSAKEKCFNQEGSTSITINHGIIAGDNANFGNIQL